MTLSETLGFLLHDWLDVESLTRRPRHAEHSRETFDAVLELCVRVARERFAPANRRADAEEPTWDGARVRLPDSTRDALAAYVETGLLAAGHDCAVGGMQLPYVVEMAANAFFAAGSVGIHAFAMLTCANANLLMAHGTDRQRELFALPQLAGRYLGTMCLSEPQAGSSLGDILTVATPDGPGFEADPRGPRYRIRGSKMWISGGEHDLAENIVHLVLAKIPGPDGRRIAGTRGISLFVVPRAMVGLDGQVTGERNDVALAGLNHKLGYRAIPNTLLGFGEGAQPGPSSAAGAIGYRIGEPGRGLETMFHMMNEARIDVGMGATMLGWAGYEAALSYARGRPQGRRAGMAKDAPQVPIVEHADVRRMLLAQKAWCTGGLALVLYCARLVDDRRTGSPDEARRAAALLGMLTPVAKSWPSEWCLAANDLAIQVHGGYGYTRDFPVEQHWRDNRLNMIHEGTHGIQALDLLGRKAIANGGADLALWSERLHAAVARARPIDALSGHADALAAAGDAVVAAARSAWANGDPEEALANATPYLQAFGHATVAWMWLEVATAAIGSRDGAQDTAARRGLVRAARYFFRYELPRIHAWLGVVADRDRTCLEMEDAWF